jgi:hypothetical protein
MSVKLHVGADHRPNGTDNGSGDTFANVGIDLKAAVVTGRPRLTEKDRSLIVRVRVSIKVQGTAIGPADCPVCSARLVRCRPRTDTAG